MRLRVLQLGLVVMALTGCSTLPREHAVPAEKTTQAIIPGFENVRYLVDDDEDIKRMAGDITRSWDMQRSALASQGKSTTNLSPASFLALSGGGDKGAYGAGMLNGWTAAGTRPTFAVVTGVSAGALIAPFAFLGSSRDQDLKEMSTHVSKDNIIEGRSPWAVLTDDSVLNNAPLRLLISQWINRAFLDEIAVEYKKGRTLLIATTNMDATQRVIWNMTKIASSQDPRAVDLFISVMMGSAAIPGIFPPEMIDVMVEGSSYQEMHVDGGTIAEVFIYPSVINMNKLSKEDHVKNKRVLYIIMNQGVSVGWEETERHVLAISGRAVQTLIHTQGKSDLYQIYATASQDHMDYNLAFIPSDFKYPDAGLFDIDYMNALYARGYEQARQGYDWKKVPPGFAVTKK